MNNNINYNTQSRVDTKSVIIIPLTIIINNMMRNANDNCREKIPLFAIRSLLCK